jgi:hypothetical protein
MVTIIAFFLAGLLVGHFFRSARRKRKQPAITITYFASNFTLIKSKEMVVVFKPNQTATFQISPTDRKGNPATVEAGSVDYSSPHPSVIVEEDPTDETKFVVRTAPDAVTESLSVDVKVSADANLGDGVTTIEGTLTVVIEPESAVGFNVVTTSEPTDIS